jgi:hygromycin-B 4-O-kinase
VKDAIQTVREVLTKHLESDADEVHLLSGGYFSRAYSCTSGGSDYVVRLNTAPHAFESFAKDDYAWRHFASETLPIPRIIAIGQTSAGWYAISEKVPGRTLDASSQDARRHVHSALLDTLDAIGRSDVSGSRGYGSWDGNGDATFASWHAFLTAINEDHSSGYYEHWHGLFSGPILERDLFDAVHRRMTHLAASCPESRALIHYDYQFENILTDGKQVTGVIDWANAMYGDSLYDVAWLYWLAAHPGWWFDNDASHLTERYGMLPDFTNRIACYQCHIGLDHLRFYAKNNNRAAYDFCKQWLLTVVGTNPPL